jgi:uncharacterized membrane protein YhaH (DUF805 family)
MGVFNYRTNRATYWMAVGTVVVLTIGLTVAFGKPPHVAEVVLIMIGVPRLHDIGKSGWLVLGPLGLELFGAIGALALLPRENAMQAVGLVMLVIFGLMIWLGCIPGQDFENRFGPPPGTGIQWGRRPKAG